MIHPVLTEQTATEGPAILAIYENLKDLAARNDLIPLDLREAYRGRELAEIGFPDDPWHPNALGHRLVAEYLDRWLRQEPFRPEDLTRGETTRKAEWGPISPAYPRICPENLPEHRRTPLDTLQRGVILAP